MRCGAVRCGAVRCGAVRCGAVRCGAVRCGAVRCGAVRCGAVRGGAVRCGAVRCGAVRCGAVQCGCESTSLASFSHPSFTHFTSCFGKPPLQGVPVSGDQKQDSGEEPKFSLAAFRPATAKQVCCSTKKCEFSVPEMGPKNVCIFDPYERPPLLILDFT
jgi:hypothetical protein